MLIISTLPSECQEALGMENGKIPDGQLSALSSYSNTGDAGMSRLNNQEGSGAWRAATKDANQWLQVDLGSHYIRVTRVATQGRNGSVWIEWVIQYKLQHSQDGVSFQYYREEGQIIDKVIFNKFIESSCYQGFRSNISRKEIALL